jgi:hypothetical protein
MTTQELEKIVFKKEEKINDLLKENNRLNMWLFIDLIIIIALVAASVYALTGSIL